MDYDPLSDLFSSHGLAAGKLLSRTFPRRRFADEAEHALRQLSRMDADPAVKEEVGLCDADLYLS